MLQKIIINQKIFLKFYLSFNMWHRVQEWKTRTLKLEKELAGIREDKSELVGICYVIYVERYRNSSYFPNKIKKNIFYKN